MLLEFNTWDNDTVCANPQSRRFVSCHMSRTEVTVCRRLVLEEGIYTVI